MSAHTGLEFRLASRPSGRPTPENFDLVEVELPEPGPGQVLVRNRFLSVDPYMRGRMNDVPSYVPPWQIGAAVDGGAVGEVIACGPPDGTASGSSRVKVGDIVLHGFGWRDLALIPERHATVVDPAVAGGRISAYLGVLGTTGMTAWAGLLDIAGMREGDVVFVSGAAGAVGSIAGQIARLRGASRVVGSAGSADKVAYVTGELGFDAAFNYKDGSVRRRLAEAAPDGIDVYFDNTGGDQLTAAISALHRGGRVALCGAIDVYNATEPRPGPPNLSLAIGKRLTLRGFIVTDHMSRMPDFLAEVGGWLRDGKLVWTETVVDGLEHTPDAFIGLLRGDNTGKMVVRL